MGNFTLSPVRTTTPGQGFEGVLRSIFVGSTIKDFPIPWWFWTVVDLSGLGWRVLSAWALPGHLVPGLLDNPKFRQPAPKYFRQAELPRALTLWFGNGFPFR